MNDMKRSIWLALFFVIGTSARTMAQLAQFNFSNGPTSVSGWTNAYGDPYAGVQSFTSNGITVSSISTAYWSPNTVPSCAYDWGGQGPGVYFPTNVMANAWLQWNGNSNNLALYNAAVPQLKLSGLNTDSTYILRMSASDKYFAGSTQYTVLGASLAGSQYLNVYNNTTQGVTFVHVQPDNTGAIYIYVNATSSSSFAFIGGLQVFP